MTVTCGKESPGGDQRWAQRGESLTPSWEARAEIIEMAKKKKIHTHKKVTKQNSKLFEPLTFKHPIFLKTYSKLC